MSEVKTEVAHVDYDFDAETIPEFLDILEKVLTDLGVQFKVVDLEEAGQVFVYVTSGHGQSPEVKLALEKEEKEYRAEYFDEDEEDE